MTQTELVQLWASCSSTEITGYKVSYLPNPGLLSKVTFTSFLYSETTIFSLVLLTSKFSSYSKDSNINIFHLKLFCKNKLLPSPFCKVCKFILANLAWSTQWVPSYDRSCCPQSPAPHVWVYSSLPGTKTLIILQYATLLLRYWNFYF